MKIVVDMNLSPEWLGSLQRHGIESIHWSEVGPPRAADVSLLEWARQNSVALLTQDLDFSQLLIFTQSSGPSVVLLRLQDELDATRQERVCKIIAAHSGDLERGALVVISKTRVRLRRLPIHPK